jgi:hypothetical protein
VREIARSRTVVTSARDGTTTTVVTGVDALVEAAASQGALLGELGL